MWLFTAPPLHTHSQPSSHLTLILFVFLLRGNKFAHNLNNCVGRGSGGGVGGVQFLAELRSESKLPSHSSPPNTVCT